MEPHVAELGDGRLIAIMRTDQGHVYKTYSHDQGETWSESEPIVEFPAPESCPQLGRVPGTSDLVLLFNRYYRAGADHGGRRNPLSTALSRDGGATWGNVKDLVVRDHGVWRDQNGNSLEWSWALSNPSLTFAKDRLVVSYWAGVNASPCHGMPCSLDVTSVDIDWIYTPA